MQSTNSPKVRTKMVGGCIYLDFSRLKSEFEIEQYGNQIQ